MKNKPLIIAVVAVLIVGLFFALSQSEKPKDVRTRASTASTTLSFTPVSTGTSPINKQVGDSVSLDMMIDPGNNLISLVRIQVRYDPTKLAISTTNPFTINTEAFPIKVEGPVLADGLLSETLSVGIDGSKVIQTKAKVGTVNFTAIGGTSGTSTLVSFTNLTQAMSTGSGDNSYQSVLASTTPATIVIGGSSNVTPTIPVNPSITVNPSVTLNPSITLNPSVTLNPSSNPLTTVSFTILLHGVGSSGDNANPKSSSLSNKSPLHPQRKLEVEISDINNKSIANATGALNYEQQSGSFKGSIALPKNIAKGKYSIKVKTPRYLRKKIPGVFEINPGKDNKITQVDLVAGNTNSDNTLDILDYNAYLNCGYGALNPLPVEDANSLFNKKVCQAHKPPENVDTDDNGIIDSADYNLFLRELSVKSGD